MAMRTLSKISAVRASVASSSVVNTDSAARWIALDRVSRDSWTIAVPASVTTMITLRPSAGSGERMTRPCVSRSATALLMLW